MDINQFDATSNDFSDFTGSEGIDIAKQHTPMDINTFPEQTLFNNAYIMNSSDPLAYSSQFKMKPVEIHHVEPHWVDGHLREGKYIEPYFRDGDGTGYMRSNPDGIKENNLNYKL